jgi:hypothetical protein
MTNQTKIVLWILGILVAMLVLTVIGVSIWTSGNPAPFHAR